MAPAQESKIGAAVAALLRCGGWPDAGLIPPALLARLVARFRAGKPVPGAIDRALEALDRQGLLKLRLPSAPRRRPKS
ncbi:MAG: hypothetical protein WAK01_10850 [Methylocystis sp.]